MSVNNAVAKATATADADDAQREEPPRADRSRYASEISSSLPLQILVYYNGLFSAASFVLMGGLIIEKVRKVRVGTMANKLVYHDLLNQDSPQCRLYGWSIPRDHAMLPHNM